MADRYPRFTGTLEGDLLLRTAGRSDLELASGAVDGQVVRERGRRLLGA